MLGDCCFNEGMNGNCGFSCRCFCEGDCPIPEEMVETAWEELIHEYGELARDDLYDPASVYLEVRDIMNDLGYSEPLELYTGVKTMQHKQIVHLMQDNYTTVSVRFPGTAKEYTYKALLSMKLEPEDFVVVEARGELQVVQVMGVDAIPNIDLDSNIAYRWVVQKVDRGPYDELVEMEEQLQTVVMEAERKAKRKQIVNSVMEELDTDAQSGIREKLEQMGLATKRIAPTPPPIQPPSDYPEEAE